MSIISQNPFVKQKTGSAQSEFLYLNQSVYSEYGVWVYGSPNTFGQYSTKTQSWEYNATLESWEPRYFGFNAVGTPVTNDDFPNDYNPSVYPPSRTLIPSQEATDSWTQNKVSRYHADRFKTDDVHNDDGTSAGYVKTDFKVVPNLVDPDKYGSNWKNYITMLIAPTRSTPGLFREDHRTSKGKLLYDTMQILKDPDPVEIETSLTFNEINVKIPYDYSGSTYDIQATVESKFTMKKQCV